MPEGQQKQTDRIIQSLAVPMLLFVVALLPRLLALDVFLTPDEYRWLGRSRGFLAGIISGDWAETLQTGYPGVTTMWTGSLGILYRYWNRSHSAPDDLLSFVQQVSDTPIEITYVAPLRLPTVLLMALFVVAFYALVSRLFNDWRVGAVAALLLALDPFHIGLSRVLHHNALATAFMTVSLLPLLGYWLQGWSRRWLILSAIAAGLSFLSESPTMFLMPFCALLGLTWAVRRWRTGEWRGWSDIRRLLGDGLLWGVIAWLTVALLWPAMWVIPLKVLGSVFSLAYEYETEGHGKGSFFMGQPIDDPGPLFYPVSWILRTTPLTLLGLLGLTGIFLNGIFKRRPDRESSSRMLVGMLLLYAVLFVAFMTVGAKKQDRYILQIYPALEILAALGLVGLADLTQMGIFSRKENRISIRRTLEGAGDSQTPFLKFQSLTLGSLVIFFVILLLQGVLVVANYPYYFTYYNPLLGGAPTAAQAMMVGWGEGLDQAAVYLNNLPDAGQLHVTAWYHNTFATFFRGEAINYASEAGETLASDYAVVYRNQIQRDLPTAELLHYLTEHHTPVFTATLQGVDYVYIYPLPMDRRSNWQVSRLPGRATFFGVGRAQLDGETEIDANARPIFLRLYWQNEGLPAGDEWWVALEQVAGPMQPRNRSSYGWQACHLRSDFVDERFEVGALLESECQLADEMARHPPGVYHLRLGVGPSADRITTIPFPEGEFAFAQQEEGAPRLVPRMTAMDILAGQVLPGGAHAADLVYEGAVRLVGYATEAVSTDTGHQLRVDLYWQALQPLPMRELGQAIGGEITLLSPGGAVLATAEGPLGDIEVWPVVWYPGQVLTNTVALALPDSVPSLSQLKLDLRVRDQQLIPLDSEGATVEPTLPAFP